MTLLLGANMSESEKLPALLIGKSMKPRCFKSVKTLPMHYEANKKVWMTSELFCKWLKKVDAAIVRKKGRIILFIDSCTAHDQIPIMKAMTSFCLRTRHLSFNLSTRASLLSSCDTANSSSENCCGIPKTNAHLELTC